MPQIFIFNFKPNSVLGQVAWILLAIVFVSSVSSANRIVFTMLYTGSLENAS